jgi:hypothetical protein
MDDDEFAALEAEADKLLASVSPTAASACLKSTRGPTPTVVDAQETSSMGLFQIDRTLLDGSDGRSRKTAVPHTVVYDAKWNEIMKGMKKDQDIMQQALTSMRIKGMLDSNTCADLVTTVREGKVNQALERADVIEAGIDSNMPIIASIATAAHVDLLLALPTHLPLFWRAPAAATTDAPAVSGIKRKRTEIAATSAGPLMPRTISGLAEAGCYVPIPWYAVRSEAPSAAISRLHKILSGPDAFLRLRECWASIETSMRSASAAIDDEANQWNVGGRDGKPDSCPINITPMLLVDSTLCQSAAMTQNAVLPTVEADGTLSSAIGARFIDSHWTACKLRQKLHEHHIAASGRAGKLFGTPSRTVSGFHKPADIQLLETRARHDPLIAFGGFCHKITKCMHGSDIQCGKRVPFQQCVDAVVLDDVAVLSLSIGCGMGHGRHEKAPSSASQHVMDATDSAYQLPQESLDVLYPQFGYPVKSAFEAAGIESPEVLHDLTASSWQSRLRAGLQAVAPSSHALQSRIQGLLQQSSAILGVPDAKYLVPSSFVSPQDFVDLLGCLGCNFSKAPSIQFKEAGIKLPAHLSVLPPEHALQVLPWLCHLLSKSIALHAVSLSPPSHNEPEPARSLDADSDPAYLYETSQLQLVAAVCLVLLCDPHVCGVISPTAHVPGKCPHDTSSVLAHGLKSIDGSIATCAACWVSAAATEAGADAAVASHHLSDECTAVIRLLRTVLDVLCWREFVAQLDDFDPSQCLEEEEVSPLSSMPTDGGVEADFAKAYGAAVDAACQAKPSQVQSSAGWCDGIMKMFLPYVFEETVATLRGGTNVDYKPGAGIFDDSFPHPQRRIQVLSQLSQLLFVSSSSASNFRLRGYLAYTTECLQERMADLQIMYYVPTTDSRSPLAFLCRHLSYVGANAALLSGQNKFSLPQPAVTSAPGSLTPPRRGASSLVPQSSSRLPRSGSRHTGSLDQESSEYAVPTEADLFQPLPLCEDSVYSLLEMIKPAASVPDSATGVDIVRHQVVHTINNACIVALLQSVIALLWAPCPPTPEDPNQQSHCGVRSWLVSLAAVPAEGTVGPKSIQDFVAAKLQAVWVLDVTAPRIRPSSTWMLKVQHLIHQYTLATSPNTISEAIHLQSFRSLSLILKRYFQSYVAENHI